MKADIFWRAYNRDKARRMSPQNVRSVRVEVAPGATLATILEAGEQATGLALRGRLHLGPFEVQTDEGVWYNDGKALWGSGKTTFRTWDEIESADP